MSKLALLSGQGAMVAGGGLVVVAAGAIAIGMGVFSPKREAPAAPEVVAQPVPQATQSATAPQAVEPAAAPQPAGPAPVLPRFSLVLVDPDGSAQVAGFAGPGAEVEVMLDNTVLASLTAGGDGAFASFVTVPPAAGPRMMSLRVIQDGDAVLSEDQVVIAPIAAPEPAPITVAKAEPAAEAAPQAVAATDAGPQEAGNAPTQTAVSVPEPETASEAKSAEPEAAAEAAPKAPAVLLANKEGVRLLQPATAPSDQPPEVMSSVALDTISYSQTGDVQLSGRGNGAGFVRIYLDNKPVTTSRIATDGSWRSELPQVDTGIYTLRVDQVSAQGAVTSRVETPFKREATEALAAVQTDPEVSVKAITVQPGTTLWAIARDRYGEGTLFVRVFEANKERIKNPDLIYPGQVFELPE